MPECHRPLNLPPHPLLPATPHPWLAGLIASNGVNGSPATESNPDGSGIQGAFKLTYFQDGLLPAAFMVGLLIASPIFAELSKTKNAFR